MQPEKRSPQLPLCLSGKDRLVITDWDEDFKDAKAVSRPLSISHEIAKSEIQTSESKRQELLRHVTREELSIK